MRVFRATTLLRRGVGAGNKKKARRPRYVRRPLRLCNSLRGAVKNYVGLRCQRAGTEQTHEHNIGDGQLGRLRFCDDAPPPENRKEKKKKEQRCGRVNRVHNGS
jgi:hypothetical protein